MDPFLVIIGGGTVGIIVALLLLGLFYPGDGRQQLDWNGGRSEEDKVQDDIDDLDQMLEAANRRRRARGLPEHTEESLHADITRQQQAAAAEQEEDESVVDEEIAQMLEAKNRRRRERGQPELTAEEYKAQLGGGGA